MAAQHYGDLTPEEQRSIIADVIARFGRFPDTTEIAHCSQIRGIHRITIGAYKSLLKDYHEGTDRGRGGAQSLISNTTSGTTVFSSQCESTARTRSTSPSSQSVEVDSISMKQTPVTVDLSHSVIPNHDEPCARAESVSDPGAGFDLNEDADEKLSWLLKRLLRTKCGNRFSLEDLPGASGGSLSNWTTAKLVDVVYETYRAKSGIINGRIRESKQRSGTAPIDRAEKRDQRDADLMLVSDLEVDPDRPGFYIILEAHQVRAKQMMMLQDIRQDGERRILRSQKVYSRFH